MSGQRYGSYLLNQMWPDVTFFRAQKRTVLVSPPKKEQDEQLLGSCWSLLAVTGCRVLCVCDAREAQGPDKSALGTGDTGVLISLEYPSFGCSLSDESANVLLMFSSSPVMELTSLQRQVPHQRADGALGCCAPVL